MSGKIVIASDSTTDLSNDLIQKYDIRILPLGVTLDNSNYSDGVDITPDYIYDYYNKTGILPKTSAVNIAVLTEFYKKNTKDGNTLIFFTISSNMSSTFNNARLAAEEFDNVYVVDTKNLSTGGGHLVVAAAEMANEGFSAEEICKQCSELAQKVDASFIIDSLEFLHKGGRCSALAAFGANLLNLKPCIVVRHGSMSVGKKYRGKFEQILIKYIEEQLSNTDDIDTKRVFITHAGCDDHVVNLCVNKVKSLNIFEEVYATRAGCTVSSHCGRNTLGVLFIRKNNI